MQKTIRSIIFKRFFAVLMVLTISLAAISYWYLKTVASDLVIDDHDRIFSSLVENIDLTYKKQFTQLDRIAKYEGISPFRVEEGHKVLKNFLNLKNIFSTIHFYDLDGNLITHAKQDDFPKYSPPKNYKTKPDPEFTRIAALVIEKQKPVFSDPIYTNKTKTFFHTYVTPVFDKNDNENMIGILSGGIFPSVQQFDSLLKGLALRKNNFMVVIDSKGHIISSAGIDKETAAIAATHNFKETYALNNENFKILSQSLGSFPMKVLLGVNLNVIEEKQASLLKNTFAIATIVALVLLLASLYVANQISSPLYQLAEGVSQISKGNHSYRISYNEEDEIGSMIHSVNNIAENIEKAHTLGIAWNDKLNQHFENADQK